MFPADAAPAVSHSFSTNGNSQVKPFAAAKPGGSFRSSGAMKRSQSASSVKEPSQGWQDSDGDFSPISQQVKAGLSTGGHYGDAGLLDKHGDGGTKSTFTTTGQLTRGRNAASTGSLGFRKSSFQSSGKAVLGGSGAPFVQDMLYF